MVWREIFIESFRFAYHALINNKLRTFLSLLGIIIGIFAIITVFTIVDSLESNIRGSVNSLGTNVVFIEKWPWSFGEDYPWWKYLNRPTPSLNEVSEIKHRSDLADAVSFSLNVFKTVKYQSNNIENARVCGASHDYNQVKTFELLSGRYFTEAESNSGKSFAIVGVNICEGLFGGRDAIGKKIKIFGREATVIGVFKKEGSSILNDSNDDCILLPIRFVQKFVDIKNDRSQPLIMVKSKNGFNVDDLSFELTGIMRSIRKLKPLADDDFALNETSMLTSGFDSIFKVIGVAGWIIGGFSILVGGFGIANIMFVSVKERTNQIGIQKSLGAKNQFILIQFLIESVLLCLMGGLLGLFLVGFGAFAVNHFSDLGIRLSNDNIMLGISISILIGVISGFVPSYTASRLDPVEAMRS